MGWRYQVPFLVALGLRVIVPDMLGYGQTSAPESAEEYTMKKMTAHIAAVIKANTDAPVILGGHDWGGAFVWRMAMYYPELVAAVFSFCVPYTPPSAVLVAAEELVRRVPTFRYQLILASGAVEAAVGTAPAKVAAFLHGNFGGTTPEGEMVFTPEHGVHADRLDRVRASPLVGADMVRHYAAEYCRSGLRGPCNWYRTRELNGRDELPIAADYARFRFGVPAMIVMAEKDIVLVPSLADGQEKYFSAGLKKEVVPDASHWVLVEKPDEANRHLGDFIASVLAGGVKPS
ncbi:alpha/beta-hydrolase [Durotheca rogersii]|uniref:alpha/beta-hydrolase n=1 Tax=Durotheca rogersii TaxID=419775 RepID=UPI00221F33C2|nr:alpha/beta-hydrolase [Durotheca rogersii]KAI5867514.1 alpha/beta-hydrolase [Durotheca rogersii]